MNSKRIDFIGDLLTVRLLPIEVLKPHEKFCPNNFSYWLKKITSMQCWTHPLLVDKNTKVIMDGHHRHQIAQKLGLKYIPCILTSYKNPFLKVYFYKDNSEIDNQLIINAGQSGKLFDSKSTRHEITINCIPQINVPLALLQ
ncbi:ParB-like nuclease [Legionella sainthelensi]|uniref:ParB N-terminal domain-containing protein n=1 Tax=Legionella sainthelensi TaxID=28087 RepID=UPI000E2096F6|nr:ParB N-terminal domain-containing protein [Legionella sainthelensi]VEB37204.1 ParB-like nuclease [Legionella sainthelensi]